MSSKVLAVWIVRDDLSDRGQHLFITCKPVGDPKAHFLERGALLGPEDNRMVRAFPASSAYWQVSTNIAEPVPLVIYERFEMRGTSSLNSTSLKVSVGNAFSA